MIWYISSFPSILRNHQKLQKKTNKKMQIFSLDIGKWSKNFNNILILWMALKCNRNSANFWKHFRINNKNPFLLQAKWTFSKQSLLPFQSILRLLWAKKIISFSLINLLSILFNKCCLSTSKVIIWLHLWQIWKNHPLNCKNRLTW